MTDVCIIINTRVQTRIVNTCAETKMCRLHYCECAHANEYCIYRHRYVLSVTSSILTLHVHVQKRRHVGVQIGQAGTLGQGGSGMRVPAGFLSKVTLTCRQLPKNDQIHQRQRWITIQAQDREVSCGTNWQSNMTSLWVDIQLVDGHVNFIYFLPQ